MRWVDNSKVVTEDGFEAGVTKVVARKSSRVGLGAVVVVLARERILAALEDAFFGVE